MNDLNQLLQTAIDANDFSGAVLIKQNNAILFAQSYGYANRSWRVKNQRETRFRIASISKMFTAVAILQLIEQGKLSFETTVLDYLNLSGSKIPVEVNVYHLLTMTAGIADWFDESGDWEADWQRLIEAQPVYLLRDNADYLPLFIHKAPLTPVGQKHQYNGAGYILLALMIERASGLPYFDYVRQHIFTLAGMRQSDFISLDEVAENVAEGYIPLRDMADKRPGYKRNIYSTTVQAAGDGGATSTVDDLIAFSTALRGGILLSADMTQAILSPKVKQDGNFRGYDWRYGFANMFILNEAGQIVRWGHTGEEDGVSCRFYHYPALNVDAVILGNQSWCAGKPGWDIHDLLMSFA